MNAKWMKLAGDLLDKAADEFTNHGCNDWWFPADWTIEDRRELVKAMYEQNGNPEEYDPDQLNVADWWVMQFLASKLKEAA